MKGRILVVDDEQNVRRSMEMIHEGAGYEAHCVGSGEEALDFLAACDSAARPDLVYLDIQMPGIDGLETLRRIRAEWPGQAVVMISGHANVEGAVEAMKAGAMDFLEKGFSKARVLSSTEAALERGRLRREVRDLRARLDGQGEILGESAGVEAVREQIARVAPTPARVLITGESGTGKELVARAICRGSQRADKAYLRLNCAAVPEELIESELFGVVKGAYTGAVETRQGKFGAADGGTLFLDEIGDMSLRAQTKLLRALQEGEIEKVGSHETEKVDVRVLAATNKNLEEEVAAGRFREDLYYRLAVVPIALPSLRARKDDLPLLVAHFAESYCRENDLPRREFSVELVERLQRHAWPGNIRELRNVVERLLIMGEGEILQPIDLPPELREGAPAPVGAAASLSGDDPFAAIVEVLTGSSLKESRQRFEQALVNSALERHGGNVTRAARDLGLERTNLHKKIKQLGLDMKREG
jgi:two-component system, NtrC family, nitrogen regulation response regulator NtrX